MGVLAALLPVISTLFKRSVSSVAPWHQCTSYSDAAGSSTQHKESNVRMHTNPNIVISSCYLLSYYCTCIFVCSASLHNMYLLI
jgi:hypothetical protein